MLRTIYSAAFGLLCLSAVAQNKWSLQKCVDYAYTHNLQLQQSLNNAKINQINYIQSKANVLPSVNGSLNNTYNFGRTIDRFTNEFVEDAAVLSQNLGAQANLTLFNGLQQWNNIMQQKYAAKAAAQGAEAQKQTLALTIATQYLAVNYTKVLMKNSQEQVKVTKAQVERMKKLVDVGSSAKGSLLDLQSQQATDELGFVTAESNYNIAMLNLRQTLNLDSLNNFDIEELSPSLSAESIGAYDVNQIYNKALSLQPSIKQSEFALKSSEKALSGARGGISPNISLSFGIGTGYSGIRKELITTKDQEITVGYYYTSNTTKAPVFTRRDLVTEGNLISRSKQFNENLNRQIGLQINLPIFNGLQTHTNVQRSKINVANNKLNMDITKQTLYKNIAQAFVDAKAAFQKFKAAEFAESAAKEAFKYADQRFTVGAISNPDYLNAKNRLQRAEIETIQNKFDYILKLKVLEFYEGKPLQF